MASPGMAAIHGRVARLHAEADAEIERANHFQHVGPNYLFARR
jgi:hypothetical protein